MSQGGRGLWLHLARTHGTVSTPCVRGRVGVGAARAERCDTRNTQTIQGTTSKPKTTHLPPHTPHRTALHRALHYGHATVAATLLAGGASLATPDARGVTPLDIASTRCAPSLASERASVDGLAGDAFAWGDGGHFALGLDRAGDSARAREAPARVPALRGRRAATLAAAKFHSAAIITDGDLLTWGAARGGRLGHGSGTAAGGAAVEPAPVAFPGRLRVAVVALGKHHSLAATVGDGAVWAWGSNRDGRLGVPGVDSAPTPRRVPGLRGARVVGLAAANKHSVAVDASGRVWAWGGNALGQCGVGTTDGAAAAPSPRRVDALAGVSITAVAAAKRHTLALAADGGVWSWGHAVVTPRRVPLAPTGDAAATTLHRGAAAITRPLAVAIAAGAAHSVAVTAAGQLLVWPSGDAAPRGVAVGGALSGRTVVTAAAGKYWTAAVTDDGAVFMFEGWSKWTPPDRAAAGGGGARPHKKAAALAAARSAPLPLRVDGLTRVASVAVGEKHSLALQAWSAAPLLGGGGGGVGSPPPCVRPLSANDGADPLPLSPRPARPPSAAARTAAYWAALEAAAADAGLRPSSAAVPLPRSARRTRGPPSLQALAERAVATAGVDPRTSLPGAALGDAVGARLLRAHGVRVAVANLDAVLVDGARGGGALAAAPRNVLARLDGVLSAASPRPSAPPAWRRARVSDGEDGGVGVPPVAAPPSHPPTFSRAADADAAAATARRARALRKKLQQCDALAAAAAGGARLDAQQASKLASRGALAEELAALEGGDPVPVAPTPSAAASTSSDAVDAKCVAAEDDSAALPPPSTRRRHRRASGASPPPPPTPAAHPTPGEGGAGGSPGGGAAAVEWRVVRRAIAAACGARAARRAVRLFGGRVGRGRLAPHPDARPVARVGRRRRQRQRVCPHPAGDPGRSGARAARAAAARPRPAAAGGSLLSHARRPPALPAAPVVPHRGRQRRRRPRAVGGRCVAPHLCAPPRRHRGC